MAKTETRRHRNGDSPGWGPGGGGRIRAVGAPPVASAPCPPPVLLRSPPRPRPPPPHDRTRSARCRSMSSPPSSPRKTTGSTVDPATAVTGVTLRASDVHPGDLFAALPGARAHGADFAAEALARGAAAVLTDPEGARRLPRTAALPVLVHPRPRAVLGAVAAHIYGDPTARPRRDRRHRHERQDHRRAPRRGGPRRGRAHHRDARHRRHPHRRAGRCPARSPPRKPRTCRRCSR